MDERLRRLKLVAHRGYPLAFPENTLLGYRQSVLHGARFVELDVQCTRDGVPVLYHDDDTRRLSGVPGTVTGRSLDEMLALSAHHPGRFGQRFAGNPVSTLAAFTEWLATQPAVTAFVEIKAESLEVFGVEAVTDRVLQVIESVRDRCVVISFDDRCVAHAAAVHGARTGWVLEAWNDATAEQAGELAPDYLFVDDEMPGSHETFGDRYPWQWAVYVVNDLARALAYVGRGIAIVETDAIGDMMDQYRAGDPVAS